MTKGKFPNGLREAMDAKNIGLTELARLVGTAKQNIERWANGERALKPEMAAKVAPYLDVTAAQLLLLAEDAEAATVSQPRMTKDEVMKEAAAQNLRSALIAYGVDAKQLANLIPLIDTYVRQAKQAPREQSRSHDQSQPATPRRVKAP